MNVGVLGHVDSGKTTLTRAIATLASTAAFDKHAEKAGHRRNTLDLGFSMVCVGGRQLALVDCPGHAQLVRAVLAASTVLDMAIVVVDAVRGVEPQTAEHLLLAGLFCPQHSIVVLNKCDLADSEKQVDETERRVRKALKAAGVRAESPVVRLSLADPCTANVSPLLEAIDKELYAVERNTSDGFVMAVDHCFSIKGKGTVMTGTVVQGECRVGMEVEIPVLKEKRKVKSMQSWKEEVQQVSAGGRAAVMLPQLPADAIQRTMICQPGMLTETSQVLASVVLVPFYKGALPSGMRLHVSTGFDTVMADCCFLRHSGSEWEQLKTAEDGCSVLMTFEKPVYTRQATFYIASKLDHQGKGCRFALRGQLDSLTPSVVRFTRKTRSGLVERVENPRSVICSNLFKKETLMSLFEGMQCRLSTGELARVESSFGKSGKVRIAIPAGLSPSTLEACEGGGASGGGARPTVTLYMKKYLHDRSIKAYIPSEEELKKMEL